MVFEIYLEFILVYVFHELLYFAQYERRYIVLDLEHGAEIRMIEVNLAFFDENKNFLTHRANM